MRVVYTSDIHIDASERNRLAIRRIVEIADAHVPDVVVVAGDAGNTLDDLSNVLAMFEPLRVPKLFVAGNHDVWVETRAAAPLDSRRKYAVEIPEVCQRHEFEDLSRRPRVIGAVAFVGSLGWYDYSFADPRLGLSDDAYWLGRHGDAIWWDKEMSLWLPDDGRDERLRDAVVCDEMARALRAQLASIPPSVPQIVAVVHTLPFVSTLPRSDPPYYLDAFTGADRLGQVIAAEPRVTHCINGHKHINGDWRIGAIHAHRRTLGRIEADGDVEARARAAVGVIDL
jgi:3',5'-cyclic AMP phosphodiesterase CpdA